MSIVKKDKKRLKAIGKLSDSYLEELNKSFSAFDIKKSKKDKKK